MIKYKLENQFIKLVKTIKINKVEKKLIKKSCHISLHYLINIFFCIIMGLIVNLWLVNISNLVAIQTIQQLLIVHNLILFLRYKILYFFIKSIIRKYSISIA